MPKFQLPDRQPADRAANLAFFGVDPKKVPPFSARKKPKKSWQLACRGRGNTGSGRKKSAGNGKGATAAVFRDAGLKTPDAARACSDVEIADVEGVLFDEITARLDVVPHQHAKNLIGGRGVFHGHPEQHALGRVHSGFPQVGRVHFAQSLEAGDRAAPFADFAELGEQVPQAGEGESGIGFVDPLRVDRLAVFVAGRDEILEADAELFQLDQHTINDADFMQVDDLQAGFVGMLGVAVLAGV